MPMFPQSLRRSSDWLRRGYVRLTRPVINGNANDPVRVRRSNLDCLRNIFFRYPNSLIEGDFQLLSYLFLPLGPLGEAILGQRLAGSLTVRRLSFVLAD